MPCLTGQTVCRGGGVAHPTGGGVEQSVPPAGGSGVAQSPRQGHGTLSCAWARIVPQACGRVKYAPQMSSIRLCDSSHGILGETKVILVDDDRRDDSDRRMGEMACQDARLKIDYDSSPPWCASACRLCSRATTAGNAMIK